MDRDYLIKSPLKVAKLVRLIAKSIDLFLMFALAFVFYPFGIVVAVIYGSVCDSWGVGQSIGKKYLGFRVISLEDGSPCSFKQSLVRNLPITLPFSFLIFPIWGWALFFLLALILFGFEGYLIVNLDSGHRLGDVIADTSVLSITGDAILVKKGPVSWFTPEESP